MPRPVRATQLDTLHIRIHRWPFSHWGCDADQRSDLYQDGESAASVLCAVGFGWGDP